MKNFKWILTLLIILMSSIWNYSCHAKQNKDTSSKQDTNASSKLIVTGTITYPAGNPVLHRNVTMMLGKDAVLKFMEGGKLFNPSANTDSIGHFELEIEIDSLKEFQYSFMIRVSSGGMTPYYLMDDNRIPIFITVDPKTRQFDIGKVILK